ncbi:HNH endonuclease [Streptomyces avermitilis]|uniref:HNH endonuclease n=1 Tax=Streptomyces avermitilis TaxID=33903 RepID=UPI0033A2A2DC
MYCSTVCAKRAAGRARKQRNRKVRDLSETAECSQCSTWFEVWAPRQCGGYARRSYCSLPCTKRAEAARRRRTESGRRYYERYRDAGKFAENNRRSRAARRRTAVYVCAYCATAVEGTEDQQRVTCGSEECLRANARQHTTARNARKRGATVETFRYSEIFERDDWVCGICHEPVDPELQFPDPGSVSLDHIHPIARGGEHSRANSQTAHLGCNLRKSAKVQRERVIDSLL